MKLLSYGRPFDVYGPTAMFGINSADTSERSGVMQPVSSGEAIPMLVKVWARMSQHRIAVLRYSMCERLARKLNQCDDLGPFTSRDLFIFWKMFMDLRNQQYNAFPTDFVTQFSIKCVQSLGGIHNMPRSRQVALMGSLRAIAQNDCACENLLSHFKRAGQDVVSTLLDTLVQFNSLRTFRPLESGIHLLHTVNAI